MCTGVGSIHRHMQHTDFAAGMGKGATLFGGFEGVAQSRDCGIIPLAYTQQGAFFILDRRLEINPLSSDRKPLIRALAPVVCKQPAARIRGFVMANQIPGRIIFSEDKIKVRLGGGNQSHYRARGYDVSGKNYITINVTDLSFGSGVGVPVVCPRCNKKRTVAYQGIVTAGHSYCKSCVRHVTQFKDVSGERFGRLTAIKPVSKDNNLATEWLCICDCGAETVTAITRLNNGLTSSCGCLRLERATAANEGENNVNYNPNLTEEDRVERRIIFEYREWQRLIKQRDNYICQKCGVCGGKLTSHHLNAWGDYPEERYDLDNGVTLCSPCHTAFHRRYGRGGNTKEQYTEWVGKP